MKKNITYPDSSINISNSNDRGLTKREYFAAMVMQGILANSEGWHLTAYEAANASVLHAEALIEELNK